MADIDYNPIRSVNGAAVPPPSTYEWMESDVSTEDAGRTEDAKMHKETIASKVHLSLGWNYITTAQASAILRAFTAQEYFDVDYLDPKQNTNMTRTFYVGDRSAPAYSVRLGLWKNVTFNIIEQ